jgi:hypothetical protein
MKHLLEYNSYHRGSNKNDVLGWADEIQSVIKTTLVGKEFKGYILDKVQIENPSSFSFEKDQGEGTIQLFFKKEAPSELDQLITDLSDVGLTEDKKIEIGYWIEADSHFDDDEYSILIRLTPKKIPNFIEAKFKVFADNDYDMSQGIGKTIAEEIKKQID